MRCGRRRKNCFGTQPPLYGPAQLDRSPMLFHDVSDACESKATTRLPGWIASIEPPKHLLVLALGDPWARIIYPERKPAGGLCLRRN